MEISNPLVASELHKMYLASDRGLSPTSLRSYMKCPRLSYLQRFNVGLYEDNIHFAFGNAFGRAGAHIIEYFGRKPKDVVLGHALLLTAQYVDMSSAYKGKTFTRLAMALDMLYDSWQAWYDAGYRFDSAETKFMLRAGDFKFNGMQDVLLKNEETDKYCMLDFKAVGSMYFSNWAQDVQVPLYSFMSWLHTGGNYEAGFYVAVEFKEGELSLLRRDVDIGTYRMLPAMLNTALQAQAVWHTHPSKVGRIPISTPSCKNGNWHCEYIDICTGNRVAYVQDLPDSRIVNSTVAITLSSFEEVQDKALEFSSGVMRDSVPEEIPWDILELDI